MATGRGLQGRTDVWV